MKDGLETIEDTKEFSIWLIARDLMLTSDDDLSCSVAIIGNHPLRSSYNFGSDIKTTEMDREKRAENDFSIVMAALTGPTSDILTIQVQVTPEATSFTRIQKIDLEPELDARWRERLLSAD